MILREERLFKLAFCRVARQEENISIKTGQGCKFAIV